jgi:3-hydroxyacyl-CoA dehydrogenase/enoyl-CoA hydratase/3-hydroxybutyryl-CoA epimerase
MRKTDFSAEPLQSVLALKHWRLEQDVDGVTFLILDREGESTNSLSRAVLAELGQMLDHLESNLPTGLVLLSGKANGFIAGADIREFDDADDAQVIAEQIRSVHHLFGRLASLPRPTAAAIRGFCLGGGLELALACDYRLAQDTDDTRIGFPEIQLGIFPGFGGTARSTRLIGGRQAMELMLTARALRARAARAAGLIDEVVTPHASLRWAARRAVLAKRKSRGAGRLERLTNSLPARALLAPIMTRQVARKARPEHYPAPYRLIELWRRHGGDFNAVLEGEAVGVGELMIGPTARNLRRVFGLMEQLKGLAKSGPEARGFKPQRVHVVGAGVMGGDIAAWCVTRGLEVTLQDRGLEYIEPALVRARTLFRKRLKKTHLVKSAETRLIADPEGKGVPRADVIIEAIYENAEAKQELLRDIEPRMQAGAVLATNTSAIPLATLASVLSRPERLIGLHFFNPVAQMPLVEVVRDEQTEAEFVSRGCAFVGRIGKFPLTVRSAPGFLVNRVLAPYLMEALTAHQEGVPKETLDEAALAFGMPMGPVELADTVGLDVCLQVAGILGDDASPEARDHLRKLVDAGQLGKKSGQGLYRWDKGKPVKQKPAPSAVDTVALGGRLIEPLLRECQRCEAEQIVDSADLLDAGVIFGTGFAPFRGGPLHYLSERTA